MIDFITSVALPKSGSFAAAAAADDDDEEEEEEDFVTPFLLLFSSAIERFDVEQFQHQLSLQYFLQNFLRLFSTKQQQEPFFFFLVVAFHGSGRKVDVNEELSKL
jgi:hypothetical protein